MHSTGVKIIEFTVL